MSGADGQSADGYGVDRHSADGQRPVFRGRSIDPGTLGFDLPFESYARIAAAAGFDHVEVPIGALEQLGPQAIRRITVDLELTAAVFSCPWSMPANGCVAPDAFNDRLKAMPGILDGVVAAGGRLVSAFFACERPGMISLSREQLAERCARMAGLAGERGLGLVVELNDVAVLRHAEAVLGQAPGLQLLFDTFHFFRAALMTAWIDRLPCNAIGWVHLSDVPLGATPTDEGWPRAWPGFGGQDVGAITAAIARNGYDGPLSLEILPAPPPGTDHLGYAVELLAQTREALSAAEVIWA